MNSEGVSACRTQDVSRPNFSRVMRTNFGDTMAEILREHSDSLVFHYVKISRRTRISFRNTKTRALLRKLLYQKIYSISKNYWTLKPIICLIWFALINTLNTENTPSMRQESIVKAMRSRRARDRRALTGEAGNASRRKVICGRHGHELRRSECVPDAGRIAA